MSGIFKNTKSSLDSLYKNYSKLIPSIGKLIVGEKEPYEYLIKSIENFINQDELIDLMKKHSFKKCFYRNLIRWNSFYTQWMENLMLKK